MASDITSGVERIAREMRRQNLMLDKETDLLYRITNGVLQIRDDLNKKKSRKENRPPTKSVAKSVNILHSQNIFHMHNQVMYC
ncbi:hypothetical protein DPMN_007955 [Dreissena polymorpha]|uniref:Uncharacterized protein n=1 Tax=Dreissena polymorpha TaxID=45954 RepID=A0A9D4MV85_DREPO|nr:hypothetical protein DPMN_007955 [Dreissena polymorpha]